MTEKTVQCIYYSPTRTTQRILDKVAEGTGFRVLSPVDLTNPQTRKGFDGSIGGDLVLVGAPVYAGTIPALALGAISGLEGKGKWGVPIGVYGTRSAEEFVSELTGILRGRGFGILAGAAFVAEHSYAHKEAPAGKGRPDGSDLNIASDFGVKIGQKMDTPTEVDIESKPLKFGNVHLMDKDKWPGAGVKGVISAPSYEEDRCIRCDKCVEACSIEAIDAETYAIDSEECIRCMACVRVCPTEAKTISFPTNWTQRMNSWGQDRKEPTIYL